MFTGGELPGRLWVLPVEDTDEALGKSMAGVVSSVPMAQWIEAGGAAQVWAFSRGDEPWEWRFRTMVIATLTPDQYGEDDERDGRGEA